MQKTYKAIIVGGGAGGLLTAVELTSGKNALKGEDVLILERNDRVGKKLIATGNGQGNLSNCNFSKNYYYGDEKFIKGFFSALNGLTVKDYFYKIGIPLLANSNGREYVISKQASAVLDIIRARLALLKVKTEVKSKVTEIVKEDQLFKVIIDAKKSYLAENVIIATGGSSAKQFGTDGTSYKLAEDFGHKKTKLYPSLVQLKTETTNIKGLKGIKEKVRISAFDGVKLLKNAYGDVLFTDFGISGDTVFNLSSALVDKQNPYVIIEFMPELSSEKIIELLTLRLKSKFFSYENILDGLVNKKIAEKIIKISGNKIEKIAYTLQNFKLKVTGSLGFDYSQVTKGGIVTDDVDSQTFMSKKCKKLYIIGEMLNVDGECGGYNLAFAFLSGILAGKNIKDNI